MCAWLAVLLAVAVAAREPRREERPVKHANQGELVRPGAPKHSGFHMSRAGQMELVHAAPTTQRRESSVPAAALIHSKPGLAPYLPPQA